MLPHNYLLVPVDFQQKYVTAPSPPGWVTRTRLSCHRNISAATACSWVKDKTFKEQLCDATASMLCVVGSASMVISSTRRKTRDERQRLFANNCNCKHPPCDGVRGKAEECCQEVALKLNVCNECRDPQTPGWPNWATDPKIHSGSLHRDALLSWLKTGTPHQKRLVLPKDSYIYITLLFLLLCIYLQNHVNRLDLLCSTILIFYFFPSLG